MIHIPNQTLAVEMYKVLPKKETYAYATDIWVEGLGDIVAEVPVIALELVVILGVYVKGACDIGGRIRHAGPIKGPGTPREGVAKIEETCLYDIGDIVVKG